MTPENDKDVLILTDEEIDIVLSLRTPGIGDQLRSIKEEIDKQQSRPALIRAGRFFIQLLADCIQSKAHTLVVQHFPYYKSRNLFL